MTSFLLFAQDKELELLISGLPDIDIEAREANSQRLKKKKGKTRGDDLQRGVHGDVFFLEAFVGLNLVSLDI